MALAMGLDRRDPSPQCTEPVQYALRPSMSPSASRQRRGYAIRIDTGTGVVASCRHPPNGGRKISHGSGLRPCYTHPVLESFRKRVWALVTPDGAPRPVLTGPSEVHHGNSTGSQACGGRTPMHSMLCHLFAGSAATANGGSPSRARSRPNADVPSPAVSRLSNSDAPLQKCLLPVPRPRLRTT